MFPLASILFGLQGGYQDPGMSGGYDDDLQAQRHAQNQGRAALMAGLLNSYMNRGQGLGDAFLQSQQARESVLQRAHEEARQKAQEARQAKADRESEEYRRAQMQNIEDDNKRAEAAARSAEAERTKKAQEAAARADEHRRQIETLPPDQRRRMAPFVGTDQFDDKWFQITEPAKPEKADKPDYYSLSPGEERHEVVGGRDRIVASRPPRPEESGNEAAAIQKRTEELYDAWTKAKAARIGSFVDNKPVVAPTPAEQQQAWENARQQAIRERKSVYGASSAPVYTPPPGGVVVYDAQGRRHPG